MLPSLKTESKSVHAPLGTPLSTLAEFICYLTSLNMLCNRRAQHDFAQVFNITQSDLAVFTDWILHNEHARNNDLIGQRQ